MKTRSLKELLQLVLYEGNRDSKFHWLGGTTFGHQGLCGLILSLYTRGRIWGIDTKNAIDWDERDILETFIRNNRPSHGSVHYSRCQVGSPFYWKRGSWNPRKKWLENQINSL